mgnify:CR=1 FL=1
MSKPNDFPIICTKCNKIGEDFSELRLRFLRKGEKIRINYVYALCPEHHQGLLRWLLNITHPRMVFDV